MNTRSDKPIWRLDVILTLFGVWIFVPSSVYGGHPRDLTGQYHGEHHHHVEHVHVHSTDGQVAAGANVHVHSSDATATGNNIQITNVGGGEQPAIAPHCLCVVRNSGCKGREAYTKTFEGISTLVCGLSFERCCFEDPWPGVVDQWAGKAPCVPIEVCPRFYGQVATDVRDYGVMGPCPGLGAVRCLTGTLVQDNIAAVVDVQQPQIDSLVFPIIPQQPQVEAVPPTVAQIPITPTVPIVPETPPQVDLVPERPPQVNVVPETPPAVNVVPETPPRVDLVPEKPPQVNVVPETPPQVNVVPETPPQVNVVPETPPQVNVVPETPPQVNVVSELPPRVDLVPEVNPEIPSTPPVYTVQEYEPPTPVQIHETPPQIQTPVPQLPLHPPLPAYIRPGPPYLWKNLASYGYGGYSPFLGYKNFSFRKRIGFGFGF